MEFDIFLSYHWRDHTQVEALAQRLRGAGLRVFFDRWYLTPGTNWLNALEKTLSECNAVAACIGAEMGPWQLREQYSALERQAAAERKGDLFSVIPVLLPGSEPPLGFLRQNTWIDLRERTDDPAMFAALTKAIRGEPPGPDLPPKDYALAGVSPYRELRYFREEDAEFLFGREAAVRQLAAAVEQHSLVAVVGASGSGKSSVVRAGLIPVLRKSKSPVWEIVTIVPGDRPLHALAAALMPILQADLNEVQRLEEINLLADKLVGGRIALRDVVERVLAKQPGSDRLLLVVDQWEELFTMTRDEAVRRRFIDTVLEATEKSKLSAAITLRGDFFGRAVTAYRPLSDRLQGAQVNLGPMNQTELRLAMEEPARKVGLRFEPGLVDTILAEVGEEPGNLPLLEFVLYQLWEKRQGGLMHLGAYEAMGRLAGAIAQKADGLYEKLSPADRHALQRMFLRLVRAGEGELDTRRRANMSEFGDSASTLIKKLSDERLLVTSKAVTGGAETVEVAHEALIRNWQLLRSWVDADRQFIVWQNDLSAAARKWLESGRDSDRLLRGLPLAQARDWAKRKPDALSSMDREFIEESARRRLLLYGVAAGVGALVLTTIGYYFLQSVNERQRADAARERAEELVQFMTDDLHQKLMAIGRLQVMNSVNTRVIAYYEKIGAQGQSPEIERRRAVSFSNHGDALRAQGKLKEARKAYEQSQAIRKRLAEVDPFNKERQHDLSVAYEKLAYVEMTERNFDAARKTLEQSLAIRGPLAEIPGKLDWESDLAASYDRLGDVELAAKNLDAARKAHERSFGIRERLAKTVPDNREWQRAFAVSCVKRGDLGVASGKLDSARDAYKQGLDIYEVQTKADGDNVSLQRDLGATYNRLGNVELAARRFDAAHKAYERSLAVAERLARADPVNTDWQRDLSLTCIYIGEVLVEQKRRPEALQYFEKSLAISERLAKMDPHNALWKDDMDWIRRKIAEVKSGGK